jgi:AhpD family alkylhydroperoxidase
LSEKLKDVQMTIQALMKDHSNLFGPFLAFVRRAEEPGVVDIKAKRLISVALAVALKCEWCIANHTKNALDAGVSRDELMEACALAISMAGAPALMHSKIVLQTIEDLTT